MPGNAGMDVEGAFPTRSGEAALAGPARGCAERGRRAPGPSAGVLDGWWGRAMAIHLSAGYAFGPPAPPSPPGGDPSPPAGRSHAWGGAGGLPPLPPPLLFPYLAPSARVAVLILDNKAEITRQPQRPRRKPRATCNVREGLAPLIRRPCNHIAAFQPLQPYLHHRNHGREPRLLGC